MSENKVLKYFGANYCPFSNVKSKPYFIIREFKNKYPDVKVEIFMSEDMTDDQRHEFIKADAKYVPTVTNGNYAKISLDLVENFDKSDKNEEEIFDAVLKNIYDQLSKEPERKIPSEETIQDVEKMINIPSISDNEDNEDNKDNILKNLFNKNKFRLYLGIGLFILILIFLFFKKEKSNN